MARMFGLICGVIGHAVLLEFLVVAVDPLGQRPGTGVGETQCADALLGRHLHAGRPRAGDPDRRMRLLHRLGDDVTRRHLDLLTFETRERLLDHASDRHLEGLLPLRALVGGIDVESAEFTDGGTFPGAELDTPVGEQVDGGDALGHPCGVIDGGQQVHDPEAQPDVLGPLAGRGQEDLRRRGVAVLLEEVVLGQPDGGEPGLVGGLHLVQAVLQHEVARHLAPRGAAGRIRRTVKFSLLPPMRIKGWVAFGRQRVSPRRSQRSWPGRWSPRRPRSCGPSPPRRCCPPRTGPARP